MGIYRFSDSNLNDNVVYSSMKAGSIIPATVSGGTETISGDYVYRAFTSSGTLAISGNSLIIDALIVAGGGAGGQAGSADGRLGGGGGGGGLVHLENVLLNVGSYTVTVGGGGATVDSSSGSNGQNSSLQGQTVAIGGGGGGGRFVSNAGLTGGSGGGGANGAGGGAGTAGQGFAGASAELDFNGGGGGAVEAAGNKLTANWTASTLYGNAYGPGWGRAFTDWGLATSTGSRAAGQIFYSSGGVGNDENEIRRRPRFATPAAVINSGTGGFGAYSNTAQAGSSGVVIIRFRRELAGL
jgi:hypothetical protein